MSEEIQEQPKKPTRSKKVKCEFIASPTGLLGLAYNVGETATFSEKEAKTLEEMKLAKRVK